MAWGTPVSLHPTNIEQNKPQLPFSKIQAETVLQVYQFAFLLLGFLSWPQGVFLPCPQALGTTLAGGHP